MYFPISGVQVPIESMLLLGFAIGLMAGFLGVGGGWIITPALNILGFPINFAIGSGLCQIAGNSVPAAIAHRRFGHIDFRLGGLMTAGMSIGVELGARIIEHLKSIGNVETVLGASIVVLMLSISTYMLSRTFRRADIGVVAEKKPGLWQRSRWKRIPPFISLPASNIESISIWCIISVAILIGLSAGFLGVGGGLIAVPALLYLVGTSPTTAVGTSILSTLSAASFGTFSHAMKGNVDVMVALVMLPTSSLGSEIGSHAIRYLGRKRRAVALAFGSSVLLAACAELVKLLGNVTAAAFLVTGLAAIMSTAILLLILRGWLRERRRV